MIALLNDMSAVEILEVLRELFLDKMNWAVLKHMVGVDRR